MLMSRFSALVGLICIASLAYELTEHHEAVPGEWHFMVFQGDRLLAEKRFTVR